MAKIAGIESTANNKSVNSITASTTNNGVANLTSDALQNVTEGHIFHVITMGKGLMWAHGSQVSPEDRWKIVMYVNQLRGYTGE